MYIYIYVCKYNIYIYMCIYIYTNHNKYDLIEKYNVAIIYNEY